MMKSVAISAVLIMALFSGCVTIMDGEIKSTLQYSTLCLSDEDCGCMKGHVTRFVSCQDCCGGLPSRPVVDCPETTLVHKCQQGICTHTTTEVSKQDFCECVSKGYNIISQGSFVPGKENIEEINNRLEYCGIEKIQ